MPPKVRGRPSRRRDDISTPAEVEDEPQSPAGPSRKVAVGTESNGHRSVVDQGEDVDAGDGEEDDEDEEDPSWEEFTADYYEVVEQLPLELHRNFALLRELDDQSQLHTSNLLNLLRQYVAARLTPPVPPALLLPYPIPSSSENSPPFSQSRSVPVMSETPSLDPQQLQNRSPDGAAASRPRDSLVDGDGDVQMADPAKPDAVVIAGHMSNGFSPKLGQGIKIDYKGKGKERDLGVNGQNGSAWGHEIALNRPGVAAKYLPEIGRLAREMIRSCDEKVGIAVGAYNSVDRHIRAIDTALETEEANLVLGIRHDTHPSHAADALGSLTSTMNGHATLGNRSGETEEDIAIGIGGGGASRKNQKSRIGKRKKDGKKKKEEDGAVGANQRIVGAVDAALGPSGFDMQVDPNEPRYCYCQNVSYGVMIGCDNEDCPMEWFHLACVGLSAEPTGSWWCNNCKPNQKKARK